MLYTSRRLNARYVALSSAERSRRFVASLMFSAFFRPASTACSMTFVKISVAVRVNMSFLLGLLGLTGQALLPKHPQPMEFEGPFARRARIETVPNRCRWKFYR